MFHGVDQAIGEVIIHSARTISVRQRTEAFSTAGEDCCCVGLVLKDWRRTLPFELVADGERLPWISKHPWMKRAQRWPFLQAMAAAHAANRALGPRDSRLHFTGILGSEG